MRALRRNVLRKRCQEIQRRENLKVPLHSGRQAVSLRVGVDASTLANAGEWSKRLADARQENRPLRQRESRSAKCANIRC